MKLKSLLLGSAAALVAFSGARAADAVIAEPEPVEYVRVCDAYGAGFFYIPGTETCLKIGGFVRYDIDATTTGTGWSKTTQANVSFTAKSDTEMGALVSYMELTAKNGGSFGMDSAYLSLGGLKMGWYSNAFDGGIVSEVDGLGGSTGNNIGYTFASGGFDATISLDHDNSANYVPNVSANAGFAAGAFAVRAFVAYDEDISSVAAKLRVGADVTEGGRLEVAAVYSDDSRNYSFSSSNWSVAAGYQQKVSDTVTVAIGAQYWSDVSTAASKVTGAFTSTDQFAIGGHVDWTPVTNFLVRAQITYTDPTVGASTTAGKLRFQRSF